MQDFLNRNKRKKVVFLLYLSAWETPLNLQKFAFKFCRLPQDILVEIFKMFCFKQIVEVS